MEESISSINKQIAIWKAKSGLNDDDLAEMIGISRNALSYKKHGKRHGFTAEEILKLCNIFGCDPNALLGYNA